MNICKQWLGGALALGVALSLTACAEKPLQPENTPTTTAASTTTTTAADTLSGNAYTLLQDATKKNYTLDRASLSVAETLRVSDETTRYNVAVDRINESDRMNVRFEKITQTGDTTTVVKEYLKNNVLYTDAPEGKSSKALREENANPLQQFEGTLILDVDEELYENATVVDDNGGKTVTVTLPGDEAEDGIALGDPLLLTMLQGDATYGDVKLSYTVSAAGYLTAYRYIVTIDCEGNSVEKELAITLAGTGDAVHIDWPDFSAF